MTDLHIGPSLVLASGAASFAGANAAPADDFWSISGWIVLGVFCGTLARVRLWFADRNQATPGLFLWDECLRDVSVMGLLFLFGHVGAQATGWPPLYIGGLVGAVAFIGANAMRRLIVDAATTAAQNIVNRTTDTRNGGGDELRLGRARAKTTVSVIK